MLIRTKTAVIIPLFIAIVTTLTSCNERNSSQSEVISEEKTDTSDLKIKAFNNQETDLLGFVLDQLQIPLKDVNRELYTEKQLPDAPEKTVMVIPVYIDHSEEDTEYNHFSLDAYILIVDHATGKIEYTFKEKNAWQSDAVRLNEITIDTAPYLLSGNSRGFGIRVMYYGSSKPNPYSATDFSLFITENGKLKRILKDYPAQSFSGEWDTNCAGAFEESEATFIIENSQTNGLYDIKVKEKITRTAATSVQGECEEIKTSETHIKLLKYNGVMYN